MKIGRRAFAITLATLCAGASSFKDDADAQAQGTRGPANRVIVDAAKKCLIDATLRDFVRAGSLVGVSALLYERNREAFFGAYGYADRERRRLMSRDTIVRLFSITKTVTAVAIMLLFDEGKFGLDDPIATYAPEFQRLKVYVGRDKDGAALLKAPNRAPTMRDLMRQTAGFAGVFGGNPGDIDQIYAAADPMNPANTLSEMARQLVYVPLASEPGERWIYSDSVDVQAYLVERLSGMAFEEFLRRRVYAPIKMKDTGYVVAPEQQRRVAVVYERHSDGKFVRASDRFNGLNFEQPRLMQGGAGLVSTLDDYMRLTRMLVRGGELDGVRVLAPQTVQLMFTNQLPVDIKDRSFLASRGQFGYGIDGAIRVAAPAVATEASGEVGEYTWDGFTNTLFWVDPRNSIAAVLFTQYVPFGAVPLHKAFRDAIYRGTHAEAPSADSSN
jgi:CubicO group peptidase (beta-lactamase class C family)